MINAELFRVIIQITGAILSRFCHSVSWYVFFFFFESTICSFRITISYTAYRSFLDIHAFSVPHHLQASVHWFLGLRHLSHAQRLQTHS